MHLDASQFTDEEHMSRTLRSESMPSLLLVALLCQHVKHRWASPDAFCQRGIVGEHAFIFSAQVRDVLSDLGVYRVYRRLLLWRRRVLL